MAPASLPRFWAWSPYAHVYIGAWRPYIRLLAWRQYMFTGREPVYIFVADIEPAWSQYGAGVQSPCGRQGHSQFDVPRPLPSRIVGVASIPTGIDTRILQGAASHVPQQGRICWPHVHLSGKDVYLV